MASEGDCNSEARALAVPPGCKHDTPAVHPPTRLALRLAHPTEGRSRQGAMDLKPAVLALARVGGRRRAAGVRHRVENAGTNCSTPIPGHVPVPDVRIAVVVLELGVLRAAPVAPTEPVVVG